MSRSYKSYHFHYTERERDKGQRERESERDKTSERGKKESESEETKILYKTPVYFFTSPFNISSDHLNYLLSGLLAP